MDVVIDSSSLISLAWAGRLSLLRVAPLHWVVLAVVHDEVVTAGLASGHADAAAIGAALDGFPLQATPTASSVDAAVVAAAAETGAVMANDVVIGRRASSLGASWLRTADLVAVLAGIGALATAAARESIVALHVAGRISGELRDAYLADLTDPQEGP